LKFEIRTRVTGDIIKCHLASIQKTPFEWLNFGQETLEQKVGEEINMQKSKEREKLLLLCV
jgi:hypothetical protein